jgi:hypothetical protein
VPPKGAKGVIITQGGSVGGDWTQSKNIAAQNSAKLAELQRLWLMEAVKYNVVPLDDRGFERVNPDIAGRPQLTQGSMEAVAVRGESLEIVESEKFHEMSWRSSGPIEILCHADTGIGRFPIFAVERYLLKARALVELERGNLPDAGLEHQAPDRDVLGLALERGDERSTDAGAARRRHDIHAFELACFRLDPA